MSLSVKCKGRFLREVHFTVGRLPFKIFNLTYITYSFCAALQSTMCTTGNKTFNILFFFASCLQLFFFQFLDTLVVVDLFTPLFILTQIINSKHTTSQKRFSLPSTQLQLKKAEQISFHLFGYV